MENPNDIYNDGTEKFIQWIFPSYNFSLTVLWSSLLVKEMTKNKGYDIADKKWTSQLHEFDIVLLSGGQWF